MDMRLTSLINEDLIELDLKATKKEDVILLDMSTEECVRLIISGGVLAPKNLKKDNIL